MDPQLLAILQMFGGGGYQPYSDFSTSAGGYLPMDSGTLGANLNQLQDVASLSGQGLAGNPLMLAALGMASGDQFQSKMVETVEGVSEGRDYLLNIIKDSDMTGVVSPEALVARLVLEEGAAPSRAALEAKLRWNQSDPNVSGGKTYQELYEAKYGTVEPDWAGTASDYHSMVSKDKSPVYEEQAGVGLQALRDLGIADPGTAWDPEDLVTGYDERQQSFVDANQRALDARKVAEKTVRTPRTPSQASKPVDSVQLPEVGPGRGHAGRHRQRVESTGGPAITQISGTPEQRKARLDAIAARDTAGLNAARAQARYDISNRDLMSRGMTPTAYQSMALLSALQRFAGA